MANKKHHLLKLDKLPLRLLGLENIPAVPLTSLLDLLLTLLKLGLRFQELKQASQGLNVVYTIGGITAPAYPFLFGDSDSEKADSGDSDTKKGLGRLIADIKEKLGEDDEDSSEEEAAATTHRADSSAAARAKLESLLRDDSFDVAKFLEEKVADRSAQPLVEDASRSSMTELFLEAPEQFSMSWTTFGEVYRDALPRLDTWAATLTDVEEANRQFWPTIAEYGLAYNLLIPQRIDTLNLGAVKGKLGDAWSESMAALADQGLLYLIDMSIFETVEPQEVDGFVRFTPATLTLLQQDPETRNLIPLAIRVAGHEGSDAQVYIHGQASDGAWLYALQAVKTSVSVWGIWMGHVYHWHIVTAAMQMTMYNTLPEDHPLYLLLAPQSNYLIAFDEILLLLWEAIAPPTSITSAGQFLDLMNTFAEDREYFDDDPTTTLKNLGIRAADFTVDEPWDRYPIAGRLLSLWGATEAYVEVFVYTTYSDDAAVQNDEDLQKWMKESGSRRQGNVRGLPTMDSRAKLIRVLTSLVYRITAHGNGRLLPSANPALTFVSNFPPCLQQSTIPEPSADITTEQLLRFLPNTGTIGDLVNFFYIFLYSAPYEPFVPLDGIDTNLFFPNGLADPRNKALVAFREAIIDFMTVYEDGSPQVNQWPLNIET